MNITTEPIRDRKIINNLFIYLKGQSYRNYMIAKVQLNTALRISDVLSLKVSDFVNENGVYKSNVTLKEKKTEKVRRIGLNSSLKAVLKDYISYSDMTHESYLFPSKKGINSPISTTQAHRIFQEVGKALNLDHFGTHSLRKSWGYFAYKETLNIALIMEVYNHSSEKETLKYIGLVQKDKDNLYWKITF